MSGPFEYVDSVSHGKTDMMRGTKDDDEAERGYVPFLTNRALSYHVDSVMHANEMNSRHWAQKLLQYDYLLASLRKRKRFGKWAKETEDDRLQQVRETLGMGLRESKMAWDALTSEQRDRLYSITEKGG